MKAAVETGLELWGGVECTVNRVGDQFFDQLRLSGHERRLSDLTLFASLGLKTLRFPMLWERLEGSSDSSEWQRLDKLVARAQELGVRLIAGLVHHGSGPPGTHLLDPQFPQKLAAFAGKLAARYPALEAYTPINEPLTTARFSGLYGLWYPHARDTYSFLTMLLNQCRAIRASMQAIWLHNPTAQLIQTEDLGKTFSTPPVAYQADFDNERRWLSFDLLVGRVVPGHPLWDFLLSAGISAHDVLEFAADPCVPSILGINHYVTSNRFLDHRLERLPPRTHGGNGRHLYADIEAVRAPGPHEGSLDLLLREAWDRFSLPLAITEVHLGSTREEQLRWFVEVWDHAHSLKLSGVDVRAVTAWGLLGSFDWNSLVTKCTGYYEPGIFDLRSQLPRPTALAALVKAYARDESFDHPVLDTPGWWHRSDRFLYPPEGDHAPFSSASPLWQKRLAPTPRPLLITGSPGALATAFGHAAAKRGLAFHLLERQTLDVADAAAVRHKLCDLRPWAVINAAGFCRVDAAELQPGACYRDNVEGPAVLAAACAEAQIRLMTFSSALVFPGTQTTPYTESAEPSPLNVYGTAKAEAEVRVLSLYNEALVIRSSAFFGPWDGSNFVTRSLSGLARGHKVWAPSHLIVSPTYLPHLVSAALDLLIDGEKGIWHLVNAGMASWAELARTAAARQHIATATLLTETLPQEGWQARRPHFAALASERGTFLPHWERALDHFFEHCQINFG